ncbi:MAG: hypothetical protein JXX14_25680 [Deltaproteobacteria bacterium]|nr:hypothetical protein [Deltaproteobacteria bacterium]
MILQTTIIDILERLADVEQLAAELYGHYARLFSTHPVASKVFAQMQREEESHRNQVMRQKQVVARFLSANDFIDVDMAGVDIVANAILRKISESRLSLKDAVDFAIWMESAGMESAYRTAASRYSTHLEKLAHALSIEDSAHIEQLKKLRASSG